jgi:hypothetical protein
LEYLIVFYIISSNLGGEMKVVMTLILLCLSALVHSADVYRNILDCYRVIPFAGKANDKFIHASGFDVENSRFVFLDLAKENYGYYLYTNQKAYFFSIDLKTHKERMNYRLTAPDEKPITVTHNEKPQAEIRNAMTYINVTDLPGKRLNGVEGIKVIEKNLVSHLPLMSMVYADNVKTFQLERGQYAKDPKSYGLKKLKDFLLFNYPISENKVDINVDEFLKDPAKFIKSNPSLEPAKDIILEGYKEALEEKPEMPWPSLKTMEKGCYHITNPEIKKLVNVEIEKIKALQPQVNK